MKKLLILSALLSVGFIRAEDRNTKARQEIYEEGRKALYELFAEWDKCEESCNSLKVKKDAPNRTIADIRVNANMPDFQKNCNDRCNNYYNPKLLALIDKVGEKPFELFFQEKRGQAVKGAIAEIEKEKNNKQ
jgi:hypothetical protein